MFTIEMFEYLSDIRVISDKYHIVKSEFITHQCCSRFGEIFVGIIHMSGKNIQYAEDMSRVDSIQVLNNQDHILFVLLLKSATERFIIAVTMSSSYIVLLSALSTNSFNMSSSLFFLVKSSIFSLQILKQPKPLYCQHNFWKIFTRNSYVCNIIDRVRHQGIFPVLNVSPKSNVFWNDDIV